jgi:hypothetical protein
MACLRKTLEKLINAQDYNHKILKPGGDSAVRVIMGMPQACPSLLAHDVQASVPDILDWRYMILAHRRTNLKLGDQEVKIGAQQKWYRNAVVTRYLHVACSTNAPWEQ